MLRTWSKWLHSKASASEGSALVRPARRQRPLHLEALEDRPIPAFLSPLAVPVDGVPTIVAAGDVDNDGNQDFVTMNYTTGTISVVLGNGDGTFQPAKNYSTGAPGAQGLVLADVNGDGNQDAVA